MEMQEHLSLFVTMPLPGISSLEAGLGGDPGECKLIPDIESSEFDFNNWMEESTDLRIFDGVLDELMTKDEAQPSPEPESDLILMSDEEEKMLEELVSEPSSVGIPSPDFSVTTTDDTFNLDVEVPPMSNRGRPSRIVSPEQLEDALVPKRRGGCGPRVRRTRVEKKERKMDQNKTAAQRYRLKQNYVHRTLELTEASLVKYNKELTLKYEALGHELEYIKDLVNQMNSSQTQSPQPYPHPGIYL